MIPRFMRLSALVAIELGSEARDEEMGEWAENDEERERAERSQASPGSTRTNSSGNTSMRSRSSSYVLRPTREWYMLFVGLLTRAVLEGYATGGWKGTEAAECLAMIGQVVVDQPVGIGRRKSNNGGSSEEDEFAHFDPDEMPSLQDAARVLFPSLRHVQGTSAARKEVAESEFCQEMEERLGKVCDRWMFSLDTSG
jgi:hypothetical protein